MITLKELIKDIPISDIPIAHQHNLEELLVKINKVRIAYGKSMTVTSGYRSMYDHKRIYNAKGIFDEKKIPMKSKHLEGLAIDIADPSGDLYNWCKNNENFLREVGIWLETRQGKWQHFQIRQFGSYKEGKTIWFNP